LRCEFSQYGPQGHYCTKSVKPAERKVLAQYAIIEFGLGDIQAWQWLQRQSLSKCINSGYLQLTARFFALFNLCNEYLTEVAK
jgi:hypothetical protein